MTNARKNKILRDYPEAVAVGKTGGFKWMKHSDGRRFQCCPPNGVWSKWFSNLNPKQPFKVVDGVLRLYSTEGTFAKLTNEGLSVWQYPGE